MHAHKHMCMHYVCLYAYIQVLRYISTEVVQRTKQEVSSIDRVGERMPTDADRNRCLAIYRKVCVRFT